MDSFWKWLMRANARGVFLGSLLGVLLTIGWWAWREYRPERSERLPGTGQRSELNAEPIGISSYVDDQLQAFADVTRGNPFYLRKVVRRPPKAGDPPPPEPPVPDPVPPAPQPPPPAPPEPDPAPGPPAPPPRERYEVEYKGLFTRSDGKTVALLRDGKSGTSSFYAKGATLHGMKVGRVTQRYVGIIRKDGKMALLKLGEPEEF